MKKRVRKPSKAPIYILISVFVILAFGIAAILYFSHDHSTEYPEKVTELENLSDAGKYEEVEKKGEELLALKPGNKTKTSALWEVSLAECMQGNKNTAKYEEARQHAIQFRKLDYSGSYYLMGLIYYYKGTHNTAKKDYAAAKEDFAVAADQLNNAKRRVPDLTNEIDRLLASLPSSAPSESPK